ncbi:MAG TPA: sulfatase [Bacteroidales bacterium]|nr:sulfatase [Bacteroidales bacterium]
MKNQKCKQIRNILLPALLGLPGVAAHSQPESHPNMVLFLADDCTYFDIGCYGSKDSKTPNIDKFASEGMLFTKGYQSAPMSSPTRHNLYTGIWPVKSGAYPNHTMADTGTLSIVNHLKSGGYRVALIGKSHVLPNSVFPFEYVDLTATNDIDFNAVDTFIYSCTSKKQPFCLFVTSNQPHKPWNKGDPSRFNPKSLHLPPYYVDIPETRNELCKYFAEINYMDAEFGKLLGYIDQYKIKENTVVLFLSEQGNSMPFAKWTLYDAGVHSAYIVRWPGKIKAGSVSDAIVEYVDITPTFCEMANVKPLAPVDGKSILPVLLGKTNEHKQYTFSLQTTRGIIKGSEYFGIRSVADKKYRYIVNLTPEASFNNAESNGELFRIWKELGKTDSIAAYITYRYQHRPAVELYDTENDPYCINNLAAKPEYSAIIARLEKSLKDWMQYCGDKGQETEMEALNHMPGRIIQNE